jgi:predicted enzyme related to lactoylglutathione lyase
MTAPTDSKELGINGGIVRRMGSRPATGAPVSAFVCTLQVENFDETAKKATAAGAVVALPKFALAGMAWQGYFIDSEGNIFGIHQPDVNAK